MVKSNTSRGYDYSMNVRSQGIHGSARGHIPFRSEFENGDNFSGPLHRRWEGCELVHKSANIFAVAIDPFLVGQKIMIGFPCPCFDITPGILRNVSEVNHVPMVTLLLIQHCFESEIIASCFEAIHIFLEDHRAKAFTKDLPMCWQVLRCRTFT